MIKTGEKVQHKNNFLVQLDLIAYLRQRGISQEFEFNQK